MAYEKTNWQTGDTVTAEKLNHAEQGIADNSAEVYVGTIVDGNTQFDLTYNQAKAALQAGKDIRLYSSSYLHDNPNTPVYSLDPVTAAIIIAVGDETPTYYYTVHTASNMDYYSADPDDPLSSLNPTD